MKISITLLAVAGLITVGIGTAIPQNASAIDTGDSTITTCQACSKVKKDCMIVSLNRSSDIEHRY